MADSTIGVSKVTADDLARVAKKNKVSRDMVISKMLSFFQSYGIDPFNYEAPHEEMTKIIKRFDQVFAFLKHQEKTILIPTLGRVATKEEVLKIPTKTDVIEENKTIHSRISELINHLNESFETRNEQVHNLHEENKKLKELLEAYRKSEMEDHQKMLDMTISNVSKMLQDFADHQGSLAIKDKAELKYKLSQYAR